MPRLITVNQLQKILNGISKAAIYNKIKRGTIPSSAVVHIPSSETRYNTRIDLEELSKKYPSLKKFVVDERIKYSSLAYANKNLIKPSSLAKLLMLTPQCMYRHIEKGLYPSIELPTLGKKRIIRVLKQETVKKYPFLKNILKYNE